MNIENATRLLSMIPEDARVIDVGGGASPFPRADYVIDAMPYDSLGTGSDGNIHTKLNYPVRYSKKTWIQVDLCRREPWPIDDHFFDFAICSHLLEDIRDPIWVCSELRRIAKAGYIETPSRFVEQSKGVENPRHAGFYHHRWLINARGNRLEFRHKPHVLHSVNDAIVAWLSPGEIINPKYSIVSLFWTENFEAVEVLEFRESAVIEELISFAKEARQIPDLVTRVPTSALKWIKRRIYHLRLSWGGR